MHDWRVFKDPQLSISGIYIVARLLKTEGDDTRT